MGIGSIPACAGEPRHGIHRRNRTWVYPRVCGGTNLRFELEVFYAGLSPRVRGNLYFLQDGIDGEGSIPACAGEPRGFGCGLTLVRVYPRVCGGTGLVRGL